LHADTLGPVDPSERVEVSVMVRPRRPLAELDGRLGQPMSREEFAASFGATEADLEKVSLFARAHGLEVVESSQPRRTVRLAGRAADVAPAFGVDLMTYRDTDGSTYRAPTGEVRLAPELEGVVEGVFGLDTRAVAHRR
jgi:kumamolisin